MVPNVCFRSCMTRNERQAARRLFERKTEEILRCLGTCSGHSPGFCRLIQIESSLKVHPKLRRCTQSVSQVQCCRRSDTSLAFDQFVQTSRRPAKFLCESCLRNTLRREKLLEHSLTR